MSTKPAEKGEKRGIASGGVVGIFTVLGAVATALAVALGAYTYYTTSEAQAEAEAVNLVREHWTLANDHPTLASEWVKHRADRVINGNFAPEYGRFAAHALFTAESAYKLAGGEPNWFERRFWPGKVESRRAWDASVLDLATRHDTFVTSRDFSCEQYDGRFIQFLKEGSDRLSEICPPMTAEDRAAVEKLNDAAKAQEAFLKKEGQDKEGQDLRYAEDLESLRDHGFRQGDPLVKMKSEHVINAEGDFERPHYCVQAPGEGDNRFRMTPIEDEPVPGTC